MKNRTVIIAGNWKMNNGPADAEKFLSAVKDKWNAALNESTRSALSTGKLRTIAFTPVVTMSSALAATRTRSLPITIGAQNAHWEKSGAFTGETSGPMLAELGINQVLIGHSERRQYFGETDETARKRIESLLAQGFQVMLCIGETRAERESNQTEAVITKQLAGAIPKAGEGAAAYLDGRLTLAYEPVWAIGTGLTATPEQAEAAHAFTRNLLKERFGAIAAEKTPILYGGSMTPDNVTQLLACPNIDGGLIGGASLKPDGFLALIEAGGKAVS